MVTAEVSVSKGPANDMKEMMLNQSWKWGGEFKEIWIIISHQRSRMCPELMQGGKKSPQLAFKPVAAEPFFLNF